MLPVPVRMALLATVAAVLKSEPVRFNVPALIFVGPLYVFEPLNVTVPAVLLVRPIEPARVAETDPD
jgi:hypothetical protein